MPALVESSEAFGEAVVGREQELAAIARLLADAREGFAALLLEGDAGIGKTTVLREGLRLAEAAGFRVLSCRPGPSEAGLSLVAVGDLLEAVPGDCWHALPPPQRRALEVAMLRSDPDEGEADQRAIAAGLRTLVTELAVEGPVLLAIDDVQWLDPASATVLGYLLRRAGTGRLGLLATRRPVGDRDGLDVASLVQPGLLARDRLGPLGVEGLGRAIRERLDVSLPRSALVGVHGASRGNPLFGLEIARVLAERGIPAADEPLPVPDDVDALVRARVTGLPEATRDVLLAAALLGEPTLEVLRAAFQRRLEPALGPAEQAGVARVDGDVVAFHHPLHAAAVVAAATPAERREMHRRLASAVHSPEERARHLALGTTGPDEAVAIALEEGADAARAQGGLPSAAELLERARALTRPGSPGRAHERGLRAAELHVHAGDPARARTLLQELLEEELSPAQRCSALRLLAEICFGEEDLEESTRLLQEAVRAGSDPQNTARAQLDLVYVTTTAHMDFAGAAELGRQALDGLRESGDGPLLAEALAYTAMAEFLAGAGVDRVKLERALELEDPDRIPLMGMQPAAVAGCVLLYAGSHDEARKLLAMVRRRLSERGAEGDLATPLLWFSWLETRCGNFGKAEELAHETMAYAASTGNESLRRWAIAQRAWVHAHRGELDAARRGAAEAAAHPRGIAQVAIWIAATLALAASSVGDAQGVLEACAPLLQGIEQLLLGEPMPAFFLPDALEALIALGGLERAEAILEPFERRGRELDRVWALATAGRCRALLASARGDPGGALESLDRALVEHERIEMPFERARTLLVKGATERRARRRGQARTSLAEAAAEFERMGSPLWAERARNELARVSGRQARDEQGLTPSERRVAELAAKGLSNKDIAARLVVSVHTVEVHLSRSYAKLGIRSRSQLAGRLPGEPDAKD
jgi:DNA-binding CsgD family transcriptional regulator/tetratricopeptide (TPR) repeat protein